VNSRNAEHATETTQRKGDIAAKELRESLYWLNLISEADLTPNKPSNELGREASELVAILTASARTARAPEKKE
jgi:four helix bundle protein